CQQRNSYPFTF
nr:immunoglobulin light chain junction region [Macaca mulatta]MOV77218.1 immunoglobulin light chain junction region [Macaca mulatta]